jgi:hypothetical protein
MLQSLDGIDPIRQKLDSGADHRLLTKADSLDPPRSFWGQSQWRSTQQCVGSVDFEPNVIVDRELITGPNPPSDHPIAEKLIEALASSHSRTSAVGRA